MNKDVCVVIPNMNGMAHLKKCFTALENQTLGIVETVMIDNGSADESVCYVRRHFPWVKVRHFHENTGFCHAVNEGIRMTKAPYIVLLNNDTECDPHFLEALLAGIRARKDAFSCQAKILNMRKPDLMDDAGDYYCALGWAFADGKGKDQSRYNRPRRIFASCACAAIYRRSVLEKIGLFDERHFAYLEDIDLGYRAQIAGYRNYFLPDARVLHLGSATSGSRYNDFKVSHSSRNAIYLAYKNMPAGQILLNLPMLLAGNLIKTVFFARKGYLKRYMRGVRAGFALCEKSYKVPFSWKNIGHYAHIQIQLWVNTLRRLENRG